MRRRTRLTLAASTVAALTGGLALTAGGPAGATPAPAPASTKTPAPAPADFDGDGYGDAAFSAAGATVAGHTGAGQIVVTRGSRTGPGAAHRQVISQNSPGVPGTAEAGDAFGAVSAAGDFNGDGFTDLAVAAPHEKVGRDVDAGTVAVLWGSRNGLTGGTTVVDQLADQHDEFGASLASGDFDGDGRADLAIGSTGSTLTVLYGGITTAGKGAYATSQLALPIAHGPGNGVLHLAAGDVNGDGRADLVVNAYEDTKRGWNTNDLLFGAATPRAALSPAGLRTLPAGIVSAIGDIDGDGYGDVAIGTSWDKRVVTGTVNGGKVSVLYGSPAGPGSEVTITQNTGAIPGSSELGDAFGADLALGDVDGDGYADLAIGSPGEDIDGVADAGSVTVLHGSPAGIDTTARVEYVHQDSPGVPGADEKHDRFGAAVRVTDLTGDGHADLVVGVPGENGGNGRVATLLSGGASLTTSGAGSLSPTALGVSTAGAPHVGAAFAE
jgi:hypothetical protein